MIVFYILTNSRCWKLKIKSREGKFFKYKNLEYDINPECIYWKKFFGFKIFRCAFYVEGFRSPIKYDLMSGKISHDEVALDDLGAILNKIRLGLLGEIGNVCSIFTLVVLILYIIYNSGK